MPKDTDLGKTFVNGLLKWNKNENTREMPWKNEKDPYKIWLSEIILQQTRVEQGLSYYKNFTLTFPDISSLAKAPEEIVFKLWEGLGYYSRCKNLITTARFINKELNGIFPKDYSSIIELKGVGPYTAAAISSFAYNLPYAVLDGNVFRVISRIFNLEFPIDTTSGKTKFSEIAQNLLPHDKAAVYNQAIMDFGAIICKPAPLCSECFFNNNCLAFLNNNQDQLPVKEKKLKIKERWLNYFVFIYNDEILIRQRITKDIWQHLYEFFPVETSKKSSIKKLKQQIKADYNLNDY
ncbi:MAG TPA: A/G-specific adenine glycosylase, partial [Flavisolibacter sp.]|nr:A/G-specific adenine glycosylase [Flavisolibacter sp.]